MNVQTTKQKGKFRTENLKTMGSNHKITAEEVISKLKDDGDFDRLRLKIVRQLKQNVLFLSFHLAMSNCDSKNFKF